jgi:rfaE bifunctional protein kinase chain/domain
MTGPTELPSKFQPMNSLVELIAKAKSRGLTVVQCHGVFDPIHLGHIQHFREAKKLGDLLVVTVTPDRHVNKGPHRPVFSEEVRCSAIAEIASVDFVAINEWPTAVEAIRALQPNIYVKGEEFRGRKDTTGALTLEEEAVLSVGGRIEFTSGPVFSASHLVNRHFPTFAPEVSEYLAAFSQRYAVDEILGYLNNAHRLKVLVVGDAVIDEYQYCEAIGKSSKEPTLVVKQLHCDRFVGGAMAVANNVANFCAQTSLITMLGSQASEEEFIRSHLQPNIDPRFVYREDAPTIVKRRFVENYFLSKLFEVYQINDARLQDDVDNRLCAELKGRISDFDIVIVMDSGHGLLTPNVVRLVCDEARFLVVNTQSNAGNLGFHTISTYPRVDFISIAENELRLDARDRRGDVRRLMEGLLSRVGCSQIAITRGANGCTCYDATAGFVDVPAFAGKVVDRVGGGDAFLSVCALCVAQKAPLEMAAFVGNVAGAEAVATLGHDKSIQRTSLARHIEHLLK